MLAQNYPITTPYGQVAGYPLNNGFHNGIDYGCPTGTPVVVNGVTIGLSGSTGYATGPHLHVGRWVNGAVTNPGVGGGFSFNSAVVTEINSDPTNGNYVRVQGDGASWVYLHLSKQSVTKGQVLVPAKGEFMGKWDNGKTYNLLFHACNAGIAKRAQDANYVGYFGAADGKDAAEAFDGIISSPQFDFLVDEARKAAIANTGVKPYSGPQLFVKE